MAKIDRFVDKVHLALEQDVPDFRVVRIMHAAHPEISIADWEQIVAEVRDAIDNEQRDPYDEYRDDDTYGDLIFNPSKDY